jgi:uncharacterized oxidoreductase
MLANNPLRACLEVSGPAGTLPRAGYAALWQESMGVNDEPVWVAPLALQGFAFQVLTKVGVPQDEATTVARSLVEANLRGLDSHGVMRLPYYVEAIEEGRLRPGAPLNVLHETPVLVVADGDWGFGQVQMRKLLERLRPKVAAMGVAVGALRRTGHIGRLGEYAEITAADGLVSLLLANTHGAAQRVAPPGGKQPRLGTNPICFGIPTGEEPILVDFGTAAAAEGKVRLYRIAGKPCPPGWLLNAKGQPTTDPEVLYRDPPGSIVPLGGPQGYKGFGLALAIDALAAGLSGGWTARPNPEPPLGNDVLWILFDPAHFAGRDVFLEEVTQLVNYLRTCPTVDGVDKILLPGDPERQTFCERSRTGIPFDWGNWEALCRLGRRIGVAPPSYDGER